MIPASQPFAPAPATRRRLWPWVLGLCLSPFVLLGLAAISYLTLDRDAAALRQHVMRATDSNWNTRVQFSVGSLTLGVVRTAMRFVHHNDQVNEARLALGTVNHASVGVYELAAGAGHWSGETLLVETDRAMARRGWSRLVGVIGRNETVLIYAGDDAPENRPIKLCIAVVKSRELVVVGTSVDADALGDLVTRHLPVQLTDKLQRHAQSAVREIAPVVPVADSSSPPAPSGVS